MIKQSEMECQKNFHIPWCITKSCHRLFPLVSWTLSSPSVRGSSKNMALPPSGVLIADIVMQSSSRVKGQSPFGAVGTHREKPQRLSCVSGTLESDRSSEP